VSTHSPEHWVKVDRHAQLPLTQVWALEHTVSQLPQATGLLGVVVVHTPGGGLLVAVQTVPLHVHTPLLQLSPGTHWVPHALQLSGSVMVLTQTTELGLGPGHMVPDAQPHVPLLQVRPVVHTWPQPPQLLGSVLVLTQDVPHLVVPVPHVHIPPTHPPPTVVHSMLHPPQLFGSLVMLTHLPLHVMKPLPVHTVEH
jgi:hypothetical protein